MNLRTKITFLNTAVAISVALLLIISIRGVVINAFRDQLKTKAVSIANNLSDRIANHIILRDQFQTARAFKEVMAKERDLEYIYVTSEEGDLFAHLSRWHTDRSFILEPPLGKINECAAAGYGKGIYTRCRSQGF
jgi:sensor histidine kinase regulating citrate/malate metabolism